MNKWRLETEPSGSVGSRIVYACVSQGNERNSVSLSGNKEMVEAVIDALLYPPQMATLERPENEISLIRFVFVNKDGKSLAMAFECGTNGGELSLGVLESIENFASKKLNESVLATNWSIMHREPKIVQVDPGGDVIGGVKCDSVVHGDPGDENDAKLK